MLIKGCVVQPVSRMDFMKIFRLACLFFFASLASPAFPHDQKAEWDGCLKFYDEFFHSFRESFLASSPPHLSATELADAYSDDDFRWKVAAELVPKVKEHPAAKLWFLHDAEIEEAYDRAILAAVGLSDASVEGVLLCKWRIVDGAE